jgi:hypothetical protein
MFTKSYTKVKLFATECAKEADDMINSVNEFIKDKEVIDIKYSASIYEVNNGFQKDINASDRILVIYKDTPNTTNE